jgi:two-component system, NarL family, response regulator YdfI
MPKLDGILTLQQLRAAWPQIVVLLLTTYNDDYLIMRGLQAGAHGYLLKDTSGSTLLNGFAVRHEAKYLFGQRSWRASFLTPPLPGTHLLAPSH